MAGKRETAVTQDTPTQEDFKNSIINLGIALCKEVEDGKARDNYRNMEMVVNLYNAIKV